MIFKFGRLLLTPGALDFCSEQNLNPLDILTRHITGDWGDLCAEDQLLNARAITEGSRILSAYVYRGVKLYVITEADRGATTMLLADEY
jgi:hypothetical protein